MGVCPDGCKGKKPTLWMKAAVPLCTVYWNKETEEPVELCLACCCCSLYTLCCWNPETEAGDFGKAQGLPVNEGADPGPLLKCCAPCPAVHYSDPSNAQGFLAVLCLTLLCPCCCGGGCIYTNFLWKPKKAKGAKRGIVEEDEDEMLEDDEEE